MGFMLVVATENKEVTFEIRKKLPQLLVFATTVPF